MKGGLKKKHKTCFSFCRQLRSRLRRAGQRKAEKENPKVRRLQNAFISERSEFSSRVWEYEVNLLAGERLACYRLQVVVDGTQIMRERKRATRG